MEKIIPHFRKNYNAKEIKDEISKEGVMYVEKEVLSLYDSSFPNNFGIDLIKEGYPRATIYSPGFHKDKIRNGDSRHKFIEVLFTEEKTRNFSVFLDFDKDHDKNKKIHLNIKLNDNGLIPIPKNLEEVNHLSIEFSRSIGIDWLETFLSFLSRLGEFLREFEEYKIIQLSPQHTTYERIDLKLKELFGIKCEG